MKIEWKLYPQGGIPEGLSEEDFLDGVTLPVNPDLMDIFKSCNIVEKSGHGVPKVVSAYGKEAFKFSPHRITVTIPFDKSGFINEVENEVEKSILEKLIELIKNQSYNFKKTNG